jgi:hypothetical protein
MAKMRVDKSEIGTNHHSSEHTFTGFTPEKYKTNDNTKIQFIERLGGLLKSYHRKVA